MPGAEVECVSGRGAKGKNAAELIERLKLVLSRRGEGAGGAHLPCCASGVRKQELDLKGQKHAAWPQPPQAQMPSAMPVSARAGDGGIGWWWPSPSPRLLISGEWSL